MKKTAKAAALFASAVLLVTGSVLGTMAFLTDTESAVNTFTVGKVDIVVDESDADGDGERVKGNSYKLIPGEIYTKDPRMTVKSDSEKAYVRMIITVTNASKFKEYTGNEVVYYLSGWGANWEKTGEPVVDETNDTATYEYRYKTTVKPDGTKDLELAPLFNEIKIPETLDSDEIEALYKNDFTIKVTGHAIQAQGFGSANEAWNAFDNSDVEAEENPQEPEADGE